MLSQHFNKKPTAALIKPWADDAPRTVTIEESIDECLHFIITENLDFNVQAKSDQKKKVYFCKNI